MSEVLGKGRLYSIKDRFEAACEAEKAKAEAALKEKVEEKPKRKKKNA